MKKTFSTLFFGLLALAAFAQEQAYYSQYHLFPVLINPAYTGFENQHQFVANARSSWTGFPGKPNTYTLMYNGPVGDKLALGGGLFSDKANEVQTTKLQFNYAFRFKIQKARIGIGLSTDFLNRRADASLLDNRTVDINDGVLESMVDGQQIFDASVGAYMLYDERFMLGLSLPNTIRTRLDNVPVEEQAESGSVVDHYIFQMGYLFDVPNQNFKLIPSLTMRKIRDTPYQIDLNVQGRFLEDKLIAGLTVRPGDAGSAVCLIGTKVNNLQFFYSFDLSFSNFQQYNGGSHEISVAYNLVRKQPKSVDVPQDAYK